MGVSLIANPPYNLTWTPPPLAGMIKTYQRGVPPKNNANYAFILHAVENTSGKAALILPNCVLSPQKEEKKILASLIESNLLSAVIALPERMFESTSIPVCILVFDHNKQTRKVEFVDMRKLAVEATREQRGQFGGSSHTKRVYKKIVNVLPKEAMTRALEAIDKYSTDSGFCAAAGPEEIAKNGYDLSPGRYIDTKIDRSHRPFDDIVADYNRIMAAKNEVSICMNVTVAKRLGFECLMAKKPDLTESFAAVGASVEKDKAISFTKSDGIEIRCSTRNKVPRIVYSLLQQWKQRRMDLNDEENRILAEFRDALLEDVMSGKIELKEEQ